MAHLNCDLFDERNTQPEDDEDMSMDTAVGYELAGRLPSQTFKDLRSGSKARRRQRTVREKYWSYRTVNAGQIGRQHHEFAWAADAPTVTMTKEDLYREAQRPPRPPAVHRRPRHYARWPKTPRKDRARRERRHAAQQLLSDVEDCLDPWFMAYVTGTASRSQDLDDHIFRGCDFCWAELNDWYVDDEMFDCNGGAVGQLSQRWEMEIGDVQVGHKFGFAGRSKAGALFLMGEEDWRCFVPIPRIRREEWEDSECNWENDRPDEVVSKDDGEFRNDTLSEMSDWTDLLLESECCATMEDQWDDLSSCSSWSYVSR